ncbi:Ig-like domain-containing protein [Cnuella takakiae]|nr:Ig-like domain-containing protein [Cnuella takakiae]OLY92553.1 hypothetical protein BUE76_12130 [Cnuella takakiae]
MKTILLAAILAFCASMANATNYYFAANGDDARTATQASSPATPWRSLTKLNAIVPTLKPGDSVLFRRGDTFYGSVKVTVSGTATAPLVFGAYGSGAKPVINAFKKLTSWTSKGNGLYEATDAALGSRINVVSINGTNQPIGRWPNADELNKGYLSFETIGTKTITDNELSSAINWTGAELVIRSSHWTIDKTPITAHTGTTLTYNTGVTYTPEEGFGYFIQNDVRTLDQVGEWAYNAATKKITVFLGSKTPAAFDIQVGNTADAFAIYDDNYIKIQNLSIEGGNENGIDIYSSDHIFIQDCNIRFCGQNGIWASISTNLVIENNSITACNSNGIMMPGRIQFATIRNNDISKSGVIAGMGQNGTNNECGIRILADNALIEYNTIDSSGYAGIRFDGDDLVIKNNLITNFAFIKDDVGGIYSSTTTTSHFGRKIQNNIILDGIGAKEGTTFKTTQQASGIYLDDNVTGVDLIGNTVARCGKNGIYLHNNQNINLFNNTCFDNSNQVLINHDNAVMLPIRNVNLKGNIFFSKESKQQVAQFNSKTTDIASFGAMDSNYYLRPVDDNITIQAVANLYTTSSITSKYNLAQWKAAYGFDRNSSKSPYFYPIAANTDSLYFFAFNASKSDLSQSLPGMYADATGKTFNGNIVLKAYTSAVLMKIGEVVTLPTVSLISPVSGNAFDAPAAIRITGSASDPDGIKRMEFYNGTTLIGADSIAPFEFTWNGVAAGNYSISVKAIDNKGQFASSATSDIRVVVSNPLISLVNPLMHAAYDAPANITVTANATDSDGVAKVEFYTGTTLLHTDTVAPYEFLWKNLTPGSYAVWAKATDIKGFTTCTAVNSINVINSNPTINLTGPALGSTFDAPAAVTITANAIDADGIAYVAFYNGGFLLGMDSTAPYTFTQTKLQPGNYSFYALAADVKGYTTNSDTTQVKIVDSSPSISLLNPAVPLTVDAPAAIQISANATDTDGIAKVEFYDGSSLIGTDSLAPFEMSYADLAPGTYNISAKAYDVKGYSTSTNAVVCTVVDSSPSIVLTSPIASNTYAAPASIRVTANASDADGIKLVEFYRGTTLMATDSIAPFEFNWSGVAGGTYTISAKAIDVKGYTSISNAETIVVAGDKPVVTLTSPVANSTFTAPGTVLLTASASDADGIAKVEFYRGSTLIVIEKIAPFSWKWTNVPAGIYVITAKAYDNKGNVSTSTATTITVKATTTSIGEQFNRAAVTETLVETKSFTLYPNPATSRLTVQFGQQMNMQNMLLSVTATDGRRMMEQKVTLSGTSLPVDIAQLPSGAYILTLQGAGEQFTLKFIKQ